jgi:hypothetical protein
MKEGTTRKCEYCNRIFILNEKSNLFIEQPQQITLSDSHYPLPSQNSQQMLYSPLPTYQNTTTPSQQHQYPISSPQQIPSQFLVENNYLSQFPPLNEKKMIEAKLSEGQCPSYNMYLEGLTYSERKECKNCKKIWKMNKETGYFSEELNNENDSFITKGIKNKQK